jgi:hypothetical protein
VYKFQFIGRQAQFDTEFIGDTFSPFDTESDFKI